MKKLYLLLSVLFLIYWGCNEVTVEESRDYILLEWISWDEYNCYTTTDDCDVWFGGEQNDEPNFCDEIRYYTDTNYFHCTNINDYGFTEIEDRCASADCYYEEL
jgi:hypothetical protein